MATLCPLCGKNPGKINRDGKLICFDCNKLAIQRGSQPLASLPADTSMEPINDSIPAAFKSLLFKDEVAHHFSYVGFKGGCGQKSSGNEYIMITNTRVLYNAKVIQPDGILTKLTTTSSGSIPLDKVSFIKTTSKKAAGGCQPTQYTELVVSAGGGTLALAVPSRAEAERAKAVIELLLRGKSESPEKASGGASLQDDIPAQIAKLSELKEKGILTEEEFNAKKKDLLAKM